jgi:hypothetical protein
MQPSPASRLITVPAADRPPLRRVAGGWVAASDPATAAMLAAVLARYAATAGRPSPPSGRWLISDRH